VIFFLIAISILETTLVNFLKVKRAKKRSVKTEAVVSREDGKS